MKMGNCSTSLRLTFTALAGVFTLIAVSCGGSKETSPGVGGDSSLGGSTVASGGTKAVASGGATSSGSKLSGGTSNASATTMTGGSSAIGGIAGSAGIRTTGAIAGSAGSAALGGNAAVAGSPATGGTAAVAGSPATGGTAAVAGSPGTGGAAAVTYPSWSFASDTERWVGATNATLVYYSGSDPLCSAGCVQMTGNLNANGSFYNMRVVLDAPLDLSGGVTIKALVKYVVPAGADDFGTIAIYAQDNEAIATSDDNWVNGYARGNKSAESGLAASAGLILELNLPASKVATETTLTPGGVAKQGFNPASVFIIGLVVVSGSDSQIGDTTFLVDSITVTKK